MSNNGWIKLYRDIQNHWIWSDAQKLKWWLDILLMANHKDNKFLLGNELFSVKRGALHTSEAKLAERWNVSRNTARNFLKLLETDGMVELIKSKKGTTLKVNNYNDYQGFSEEKKPCTEQPSEQPTEQPTEQPLEQPTEQIKNHKLNTNNNVKNLKNEKECIKNDNNVKKEDVVEVVTELSRVLVVYENEIGLITPTTSNELDSYLSNGVDADLIIKAIELAVENNVRRLSYVKGILNNCLKDNTHTLHEYEVKNKTRKNNKYETQDFLNAAEFFKGMDEEE